MKRPPLAVLLVYLSALALTALALASPRLFHDSMQEDAWAEWATFAGFVIAGGLIVQSARAPLDELAGVERRLAQIVLVLLGLFCLAVAGEEISWGQRLLGYTPPEVFLEENFQQELNLHNLTAAKSGLFGIPTESRHLVAYFAVVYGLLGPGVGRLLRWIQPAAPPVTLAPLFFAVALVEWTYPLPLTGEAAELSLALAMIASARGAAPERRAISVGLALLLGPVLALVTSLLHAEDAERTAEARAELEALAKEIAAPGVIDDGLYRKKSVHKRIYTANGKYLKLPGEKRYFIDPWGNPYWLHYRRGKDTLWLYSFGADRKRNLRPEQRAPGGDDVLVEVPLTGPAD